MLDDGRFDNIHIFDNSGCCQLKEGPVLALWPQRQSPGKTSKIHLIAALSLYTLLTLAAPVTVQF